MINHLLIIDPQNDFCDGDANGALAVPGASKDMVRLAGFVERNLHEIDMITVTLDSHHLVDIGHPAWWRDNDGNPPDPFTMISSADIEAGIWHPADRTRRDHALSYLRALETGGRYVHTVWPPHCLVGAPGHAVHPVLMTALDRWALATGRQINWVMKGLNPETEHYSAVKAEVPAENDTNALPNLDLIKNLVRSDRVFVAGEALSHCVKSTVEDVVEQGVASFGIDLSKRLVLLTDAMSPVPAISGGPDFPAIGRAFINEMIARGASTAQAG